jgi:hypothetical protein
VAVMQRPIAPEASALRGINLIEQTSKILFKMGCQILKI